MRSRIARLPLAVLTALLLTLGLTATASPASAKAKKPGAFKVSSVTTTTNKATITWTASKGATKYRVCLFSSGTATKCRHLSGYSKKRTRTFKNLKPTGGTDWIIRVEAANSGGKRYTAKKGFNLKVPTAKKVRSSAVSFDRFTAKWDAVTNAGDYVIQVSTDPNFKTGVTSKTVKTRSHTSTGLKASTKYYARVQGRNGSSVRGGWSPAATLTTSKAPSPPADFTTPTAIPVAPVHTGGFGDNLTFAWPAVTGATRYDVQISPIKSFSSRVSIVPTTATSIDLKGLNGGSIYYTRIRAISGNSTSNWGPVTEVKLAQPAIKTSIVTYNLCGQNKCRDNGVTANFLRNVPLWPERKTVAGDLVKMANPDIIVTQESGKDTNFYSEFPGYVNGSYKSAKSLFYRESVYTSADSGWIQLDSAGKRFAVWEKLRVRSTGSTFYVVNAHLTSGKGAAKDKLREAETKKLYDSIARENIYKLPVVWAGDWNSNASNANQNNYRGGYDAPQKVFASKGIKDSAKMVAPSKAVNLKLNSANYGSPNPLAKGHQIDGVFLSPTTTIQSWRMLTDFTDGSTVFSTGKRLRLPLGSDHNPISVTLTLPAV